MRYKAGLETRDKILEATRRLIATEGLDGTTIKAICEQAGVLPGSFYNLFDSKEQAILSVVRQAIDAIDPDPEHTGTDTLSDLVDAYIRFVTEQGDLARVYIRLALSGGANNSEIQGGPCATTRPGWPASPPPWDAPTPNSPMRSWNGAPRLWSALSTGSPSTG
jgi:AcrR family transcriptional regulator